MRLVTVPGTGSPNPAVTCCLAVASSSNMRNLARLYSISLPSVVLASCAAAAKGVHIDSRLVTGLDSPRHLSQAPYLVPVGHDSDIRTELILLKTGCTRGPGLEPPGPSAVL